MFKVYSEVKGYICCAVPDLVTPMWTGLTMAGGCQGSRYYSCLLGNLQQPAGLDSGRSYHG